MRLMNMVLCFLTVAGLGLNAAAAGKAFGGFDASAAEIKTPAAAAPQKMAEEVSLKDLELWNSAFSGIVGGIKTEVADTGSFKSLLPPGEVTDRINLAEIANRKLITELTFKTAAGDTVYVSGAKAINCEGGGEDCSEQDRAFLLFHTGKETIFLRGKDIANFSIFMKKEQNKFFKGDKDPYKMKLSVKPLAIRQSVMTVEYKRKAVLSFTLDELAVALNKRAVKLKAGAHHNLFYNDEVVQDAGGNAHFGSGRQVTFSPLSSDPVQFVSDTLITAEGVTLPIVEKNYGFRIVGGFLEIYKL